jgi:histidyl-tRNA synthetase
VGNAVLLSPTTHLHLGRDRIFESIISVFKRHGGTALDTPVFELKDILAGKVCCM